MISWGLWSIFSRSAMLLESISWLQCVMFRVTILLRFSLIMTVHPRMHLSLLHEFLELGDDTYVEAALQCPSCRRTVCRTTDLCFFVRKPGCRGFGGAVYLILKPGIPRPSGIRQVSPKWGSERTLGPRVGNPRSSEGKREGVAGVRADGRPHKGFVAGRAAAELPAKKGAVLQ